MNILTNSFIFSLFRNVRDIVQWHALVHGEFRALVCCFRVLNRPD